MEENIKIAGIALSRTIENLDGEDLQEDYGQSA